MEKAFARRPEWHVEVCDVGDGEPGDEPCAAARTSLFHWGEYERIDWQRVHE